ncbi:alpha-2-macroglobulin [Peristeroidobacter soli]|uniref:alpha-2-macroglobulin n=1 Tax=Peristeroidobacter soli TaxID=2497877 RepID=UPI00101C5E54|nr:alpha-2-macroglobulin [Peristeroidobacter soli]
MDRFRSALRTIFGELNWQPPGWVTASSGAVRQGAGRLNTSARANPRGAALVVAGIAALIAAAWFGWHWYKNRPQPVLTEFAVTAPGLTCYACEPPGPPNPLVVNFSASTATLERAGHPIDPMQAGIDISPAVAGQWFWDDDRTLRFQPAADWPIGQRYKVELSRKHFAAAHVTLKDYQFEFESPAFVARLANTEFHQDPVVAGNKKVVASISFSHPVDPESFEKRVKLKMFNKVTDTIEKELTAPAFTVIYDKLKLNAFVHSAQLEVPPKAGRLQITIEPGTRAARGGNESKDTLNASVEVPGLNSLKISNLGLDIVRDERNEPDQVILINTSFSVLEKELPPKVHVWLLPEKHPDPKVQGQFSGNRPFPWTNTTFRPEVLTAQTALKVEQIPGEQEHYELHSLRYQAAPGRYLYIKIDAGLKSFGGYALGDSVERIIQVPEFPRELSILHSGSLLSMSGEKTVSLFARNVPAIRVEIGRLLPRQLQHLVTQTSGNFGTPQFNNWAFESANITERFYEVIRLETTDPGKAQYESVDLGKYLDDNAGDRRGVFLFRVQAWNPENNQALDYAPEAWNQSLGTQLADARLIVVTDLGLVVKRSVDGSQDVFVQSIATGAPISGASVEIIGRNGLPVLTETSDTDGHVRFPELRSFQREKAPVLYLARRGGDSSFLPLDYRGRSLDLSRFDIGGVESNADRAALSAYIFSDRGIYRPGEEIRAGALVRKQDWSRGLSGLPLRLEVTDPQGTVIRRETFKPGAAGFGEILQPTKETSPTGTYTLALSIVRDQYNADLIGSTTVQVRDFQPDRLRMKATFSATSADGWVPPDNLEATVQLENLFGTPAENRRIVSNLTLTPSIPSFRAYPDYQFHDPQYAREGFSEQLADTTTDAQGKATLSLNLQRFAKATYRVHLVSQGFEADGGRGVTTEAAQLVSNMPYLVGYKADGELGYLSRNGERNVHFIAIDPKAQRTEVSGLVLTRLETRFVSVLMRQANGTYKYESRRKETSLGDTPLTIAATGYSLKLATDAPGNFAYVVKDASGQQLARLDYQVAGEGNVTRTLEKNAELQLTLSKRDYAPGEEVEVSIRAPYEGAGLITIERERVYAWKWFKTSTTSSVQKITLPAGLEGNAYVSVTFVRDSASSEIYTSPMSYGVQPFSIAVDARRNPVTVEAPTLVKPGQDVTFRYRTEKPSRLVLFAVDEGILQVAAYKTPDPLGYFFQKRALEVSTTQILDLILPEFRQLGLAAAPGGDAEGLLGKHLNPFRRKGEKPVAYWSGIVDADSTTRELKYTVPDYFNGTLRVMAVAVTDDRVGVHESRTLVRGDFVLSPNAPTTVSPGDEFDVSVGVSNNVEGSGASATVTVTLETDAGLEVVGEPKQDASIAEGREGSVRFRLRAKDVPGAANMSFTARTGNASGKRRIDLSVRPATPFMTQLSAGVLQTGEKEIRVERQMYPHHRTLDTGASMLPLQFAHGFVAYLSNYPYACTEQIVSMSMPAVLLTSRPEFGYVKTRDGSDVSALIGELRSRQTETGAYKLWPGGNEVVEFVSLYAQQLLLEAGERGQAIPGDLVANGNNYLHEVAQRDGNNLTDERQSAYAIYLLTRQGQRMAAEITAARKRLAERYRGQWEKDLTAAWLAASLDLMRQDRDAESLISGTRFDATGDELYNDPMTRDALLLFIISRHFPERLKTVPGEVFTTMAKRVTDGYYHSLSAGTTLLALDAYASATEGAARNLAIAEVLKNKSVRALTLPEGLFPTVKFTDQAAALRFTNNTNLNAYYLIEQSGFDRKPPTQAIKQGLEVLREYTDGSGKPITSIKMGQQIDVHLKFRGLKEGAYSNIALVDLLPGGFELVVPTEAAQAPFSEASSASEGEGDGEYDPSYEGWQCQVCVGNVKAALQYADMREDRVVFYANASGEVSEIVYRIKATNVGSYVTPPAYGEAMYDRSVVGRSAAGRIEVSRP